nr:MAG: hypothetical protein [Bee densovirus 6]
MIIRYKANVLIFRCIKGKIVTKTKFLSCGISRNSTIHGSNATTIGNTIHAIFQSETSASMSSICEASRLHRLVSRKFIISIRASQCSILPQAYTISSKFILIQGRSSRCCICCLKSNTGVVLAYFYRSMFSKNPIKLT